MIDSTAHDLIKFHGIHPTGVIIVGAHYGEEVKWWKENYDVNHFVLFEPNSNSFGVLQERMRQIPSVRCQMHQMALGSDPNKKFVTFYVETANNGQSCSVLKPKKHLDIYGYIQFPYKSVVPHALLDSFLLNRDDQSVRYNILQIDVQGFELEVLKGSIETLKHIDAIYTEVNTDELYENCVQLPELTLFLEEQGFMCVSVIMQHQTWGDALYIRRKKRTT